jgi:hypothetical protein
MLYVFCFTAMSLASRTCLRKMNATNGTERPLALCVKADDSPIQQKAAPYHID